MIAEFRLPDLGEGLTEAEVVQWLVAPGDSVALNQTLAEVETAKAVVELPSPYEGTVSTLHADAGETVAVGAPLIAFDIEGDDPPASRSPPRRRRSRTSWATGPPRPRVDAPRAGRGDGVPPRWPPRPTRPFSRRRRTTRRHRSRSSPFSSDHGPPHRCAPTPNDGASTSSSSPRKSVTA